MVYMVSTPSLYTREEIKLSAHDVVYDLYDL